jgi:3-dehydroquinate dehydratase-2
MKNYQNMKILLMNGPNLNLLGIREKSIYGNSTFEDYFQILQKEYPDIELEYYQSNVEGELINKIHERGFDYDGIIINAGAYTHTSIAIRDAISGVKTPSVEVHISNILTRESFRHVSLIGPVCIGSIMGFGLDSYRLGIEAILEHIKSL